jgi:hypothetical protein
MEPGDGTAPSLSREGPGDSIRSPPPECRNGLSTVTAPEPWEEEEQGAVPKDRVAEGVAAGTGTGERAPGPCGAWRVTGTATGTTSNTGQSKKHEKRLHKQNNNSPVSTRRVKGGGAETEGGINKRLNHMRQMTQKHLHLTHHMHSRRLEQASVTAGRRACKGVSSDAPCRASRGGQPSAFSRHCHLVPVGMQGVGNNCWQLRGWAATPSCKMNRARHTADL